MASPSMLASRFSHLVNKEIWKPDHLRNRSPRGLFYALLRVVSITWTVFNETKAASRAAALSYSSLLGLGPLIAITMLVAGFALDTKDPDLAVNTLNRMIKFVAPQVTLSEESSLKAKPAPQGQNALPAASHESAPAAVNAAADASPPTQVVQVKPELVRFIDDVIKSSKSGTAGATGVVSLVFIVLMLFTSVENAFNEIWGVRRGRSWLLRVVFYWTIVTLGALLFFASVTALGAGAFLQVFLERIPLPAGIQFLLSWLVPLASVSLLVGVLTLFYRFVPNTHVFWKAAFVGAVVVTVLVFMNNLLAFTYLNRVLQTKSLYGSVSIIPILMLGLYIFWLFVLVGGQVSYAVQNVHFRNSQAAWSSLTETMRERLSLVVLLTVCRRFQGCLPPYTASELGDLLRVPTQIVNECINRLVDMGLITPLPSAKGEPSNNNRFQPAKPVSRISLQEFKHLDDNFGDDPTGEYLCRLDPIMRRYDGELDKSLEGEFFTKSFEELFKDFPAEGAHATVPGSQASAKH